MTGLTRCLLLGLLLALASASLPAAEEAAAETAADAPETGVESPTADGAQAPAVDGRPQAYDWSQYRSESRPVISNGVARVQLSHMRGAIWKFELLDSHPIPVPEWRGGEGDDTDTEAPLAVLSEFKSLGEDPAFSHLSTDLHNYVNRAGLLQGVGPTEGPWRLIEGGQEGDDYAVLGVEAVGKPLRYRLVYRMDPARPTVHVQFVIENRGEEPIEVQPQLIAVNGIHQDDPRNEDYDMAVVASFDGDAEGQGADFEKWGLPAHGQAKPVVHPELGASAIPAERIRYAGLKSRFFTAFWTPKSVQLTGAEAADESVDYGQDVDLFGQQGGGAVESSVGHHVMVQARGYEQPVVDGLVAKQAWIEVALFPADGGSEFTLQGGERLIASWALTCASMTDQHLDLLTEAEQRIEFTDGLYNFFKILVQILGGFLDVVVLVVQSYGLAVIVFVILIKALLHRLNVKQQRGMARMQEIAPKIKALQERYKHDQQTMQRKMFELYKEEKFNPAAGCLPILIQMPIFFAMFQTFRHYAPMREHGFLWIDDLTMPDQVLYFGFDLPLIGPMGINPLPLIYMAFWIWAGMAQKIPENAPDQQKQMAKMMRWLPIVFGIFLYNFPSGLILYMLCSSVIGNLEMRYLRKKYGFGGTPMPA